MSSTQYKVFLQSCLAKSFLTQDQLIEQCNTIFDQDCDPSRIIEKTKSTFSQLGLDLISGIDQITGITYWCVIDHKNDSLLLNSTKHSSIEVLYYKLLIEAIVTRDDKKYYISSHDALKKSAELNSPSFRTIDAQRALDKFTTDGLLSNIHGYYVLGNRAFLELVGSGYLKDFYEDFLVECKICNQIATTGRYCEGCGASFHIYCFNHLKAGRKNKTHVYDSDDDNESDTPTAADDKPGTVTCLNCSEILDQSSLFGTIETPDDDDDAGAHPNKRRRKEV